MFSLKTAVVTKTFKTFLLYESQSSPIVFVDRCHENAKGPHPFVRHAVWNLSTTVLRLCVCDSDYARWPLQFQSAVAVSAHLDGHSSWKALSDGVSITSWPLTGEAERPFGGNARLRTKGTSRVLMCLWNWSVPRWVEMIAVASGVVKDTRAPVRLLHTLSINMIHAIPTDLLFLLGEGISFGCWYCQVMEMLGAIWNNAAKARATHNGCEVATCLLTLDNHNGCIVVSLGSQVQGAQTVASWPQRVWYWSVYPAVHRIRSGSWRFTNS